LIADRLERLGAVLQSLQEGLPQVGDENQRKIAAGIASLRIPEVVGKGACALPPNELANWLGRAVEHLEIMREDLLAAVER
ncbi:MAG: hypothetical protein M0Z94_20530, partial [Dehalococcoidales bacterium]|nr:hypothetical protein [Dehalococcoidales bacterium]